MKLTEIAIDGYRGTRDTRLQTLSSGLNVVFSLHPSTCNSICNFVLDILYGPDRQSFSAPAVEWPHGYLHVQSGGEHYRLARPHSNALGELAISDLTGTRLAHRTPDLLTQLDQSVYGTFFHVRLGTGVRDSSHLVSQLLSQFDLRERPASGEMPFAGDRASYQAWKSVAEARIARLESVRQEIATLGTERAHLVPEQEKYNRDYRDRLAGVERELSEMQSRFDTLASGIRTEQSLLADLDRQIAELLQHIEREEAGVRHVPVTQPATPHAAMFYDRLDEIDNQIRRWRQVQSDIQDQRVRLRDEMVSHNELSIESHDHPYHGTRDILLALEARVNGTEEIARTWEQAETPVENSRRLNTLCHEMRNDLRALCHELDNQYKHVRHKATVAELKQLRRCYHEMDENVKRLLVRRESVIDELRRLDPAGAEAIQQGEQQFTMCAEQEGYLVARQRFVSGPPVEAVQNTVEYRTVYPDLSAERQRLAELQSQRRGVAERLTGQEAGLRALEPQRSSLVEERNRLARLAGSDGTSRIREIDSALQGLEAERVSLLRQIELDRPWFHWQPNYLLGDASRYLQQLSDGRLTQVWVEQATGIRVRQRAASDVALDRLATGDQSLVRLSLAMAAVEQLALRGIRLPMLVEDDDHGLATGLVIPALVSFCGNGHQVLLVSASPARLDQARHHQVTVSELPDTHITSPTWVPETPTVPRHGFPQPPSPPAPGQYYPGLERSSRVEPLNPLPLSSPLDTRPWSAPTELPFSSEATPVVMAPRATRSRKTMLQDIDLVESIYLAPMESLGIRTIDDLLNLDLDRHETDLNRRGFTVDQIDRWQAQAWLLICLPELATGDARVLVGSGIDRPETILQLEETDLLDRIRRYLDSSAGRRSSIPGSQFTTARIRDWQTRLRSENLWPDYTRSRFRQRSERPAPAIPETGTHAPTRSRTPGRRPAVPSPPLAAATRSADREPVSDGGYRFFLKGSDDIEAAPSIGPKTAEKFYAIGVNSVDDFLGHDAADMAGKIENRRISKRLVGIWQNQTRLMCQVPNLRGHDVQILVSCGFAEPRQIAAVEPVELLEKVTAFVETKEGSRVLRSSKKPDLGEVTDWIEAAKSVSQAKAA